MHMMTGVHLVCVPGDDRVNTRVYRGGHTHTLTAIDTRYNIIYIRMRTSVVLLPAHAHRLLVDRIYKN